MASKTIPKKVKSNIKEYLDDLKKDNLRIEKVYLFGSYAKGKQHKNSDIDLCIISPNFKGPWGALRYLWSKRMHDDGITIEPVGFSKKDFSAETTLIQEIKATGIRVY